MTEVVSVSVVIPCRDRGEQLRESVQSVLLQSRPPAEVIIVDDGSQEDLPAAVSGLVTGPTALRILRHGRRRGANAARNTGVEAATSELVAFQDSDDLWLPEKLERQVAAFDAAGRPGNALVYCDFARELLDAQVVASRSTELTGDVRRRLLVENVINTPTVLVPRQHFMAYGFDESLPRLQDWDAWLSMLDTTEFLHVNEVLVRARESPDSLSRDPRSYRRALLMIARKHHRLFARDPELAAAISRRCVSAARKDNDYRAVVTWSVRHFAARLRRFAPRPATNGA